MNAPATPQWAQWIVSALLVTSGLLALTAGWGLARLRHFFLRMHPPALVATGASWCVALATIIYFSATYGRLAPSSWLSIILLSITVPITSILLARTALSRRRQQNDPAMPAPLPPNRNDKHHR